MIPIITN